MKCIIRLTVVLIVTALIIPIAHSEEIVAYSNKNFWHIWRWYELVSIKEDGKVDVWVKIRFEFLNATPPDHKFYIKLELPNEIEDFYFFPEKETNISSFLNYTFSDNKLEIELEPSIVKSFRFYEVAFHYTTRSLIVKKGYFWDPFTRWELSLEINIDDLIPAYVKEYVRNQSKRSNMKPPTINVFAILPNDASLSRADDTLEYLTIEGFSKAANFRKFENIEFWN